MSTFTTKDQPIYRSTVPTNQRFTVPPNVILSLMGYQQNAPANGNVAVGFDAKITNIRTAYFDVIHTIYGSPMAYLVYMYLTVSKTNTNFFLGEYNQVFDTAAISKSYSFDVALNTGESYSNFATNKIEMKGFLAGYKMRQGTATKM